MSDPAIRTQRLGMEYRGDLLKQNRRALTDLSIRVEPGETYGYLGANGAGKSTTIKVLVGLIHATEGRADIFGLDVRNVDSRRDIGFLPENPFFYEYLTGFEAMDFYGSLLQIPRAERRRRVAELLARVGLAEARDVRIREFSKGMRQRLGLAQALVGRPRLVILDEPMSGLDPIGRRDIRRMIVELKAQGVTVFFSSHILSDVEQICDRVCILKQGRVVKEGTLDRVLDAHVVAIDVTVEGVRVQTGPPLSVQPTEDREPCTSTVGSQEEVDALLAAVRDAGGRILSVIPRRETLEEVFVRTGRARPDDG